jgi:hypothetical protein
LRLIVHTLVVSNFVARKPDAAQNSSVFPRHYQSWSFRDSSIVSVISMGEGNRAIAAANPKNWGLRLSCKRMHDASTASHLFATTTCTSDFRTPFTMLRKVQIIPNLMTIKESRSLPTTGSTIPVSGGSGMLVRARNSALRLLTVRHSVQATKPSRLY